MVNDTFDIDDEERVNLLVSEGYIEKEEESECKNCIDESNQNINAQSSISTSQDSSADNNQGSNVDNNSTDDNQDSNTDNNDNHNLDPQNSTNQVTVLTSSENTTTSLPDEKPKSIRKTQIKKKDE